MVNPALNGYQGEQFLADPDEQARSGKRLAAALFDPNGPTSPMRMSTGVMFGSPGAGGSALPPPAASSTGARLPETEKMHILERTHNKSSRLHNMQEVLRDITDDDIPKVGEIKGKGGGLTLVRCTRPSLRLKSYINSHFRDSLNGVLISALESGACA